MRGEEESVGGSRSSEGIVTIASRTAAAADDDDDDAAAAAGTTEGTAKKTSEASMAPCDTVPALKKEEEEEEEAGNRGVSWAVYARTAINPSSSEGTSARDAVNDGDDTEEEEDEEEDGRGSARTASNPLLVESALFASSSSPTVADGERGVFREPGRCEGAGEQIISDDEISSLMHGPSPRTCVGGTSAAMSARSAKASSLGE